MENMMRTKSQIIADLDEQQHIQMANAPTSKAWQDASKRIHELAKELTGKEPQDAKGK